MIFFRSPKFRKIFLGPKKKHRRKKNRRSKKNLSRKNFRDEKKFFLRKIILDLVRVEYEHLTPKTRKVMTRNVPPTR